MSTMPRTDTVAIPLESIKYPGLVALVDREDFHLVSGYRWWVDAQPSGLRYARAAIKLNGETRYVRMHRLILGVWDPKVLVDHQNHDGLDNRRANIRVATQSSNQSNQRVSAKGTSRFKGVSWDVNRSRWSAQIKINYRKRHLGYFESEEDAARSYDAAAVEAFGEFARPNFDDARQELT